MSFRVNIGLAAAACVHAASSTALAGPEWVETGDAGSLPSDAQLVTGTGSITKIRGNLQGTLLGDGDIADAYIIQIDQPTSFFASTVPLFGGAAEFDTQLWLMQIDGHGLLGNNNTLILTLAAGEGSSGSTLNNFSTDSTEIVITEPGQYLLCISNVFTDPFSATGPIYSFSSSTEVSGPDGAGGEDPVTQWNFDPPESGFLFGEYEIVLNGVVANETNLVLGLDIKAGSCPNNFNRHGHGVMEASLLGTADFDVHDINLATVRLSRADGIGGEVAPNEGPPGPSSQYKDKGVPYTGNQECGCHEINEDGFIDLVMKFRTDDIVAALDLNSLSNGALVTLRITGELDNGTTFTSFDCIRLVPPGTPPGQVAVRTNVSGGWIDATPLDLQLDGGGFGQFNRTYPQTTVVTLTAPAVPKKIFRGWSINGSKNLVPGSTLTYTVNAATQSIEAIYRPIGTADLSDTQ